MVGLDYGPPMLPAPIEELKDDRDNVGIAEQDDVLT